MGFAELHFHLLPGLDDGPATIEDSIELARMAAAEGTRTIVTTPHVNLMFAPDVAELPGRTREVSARLRQARIPVEVHCGGELAAEMVPRLSQSELDTIAQGPPGRRWLLLEAPLTGMHGSFTETADELRARGFAIVVAHPERSLAALPSGWPVLERELAAGSALQLNAWSLAGLNGGRALRHAVRLLGVSDRVAVASDAHGPDRAPSLRLGVDVLGRLAESDPRRFVDGVPNGLLKRGLPNPTPALAA